MPAERAPMRKVREVLRSRHALGVSERQIALTTGLSRSTVGEYLRRGTGSIQLYLRRGALVGRARRLEWGARQRLQRDRRRAEGGGLRQPQGRRHSGLPL